RALPARSPRRRAPRGLHRLPRGWWHLGSSPAVPDLRRHRVLRPEPQAARHCPFPGHRTSHGPRRRARRDLVVVLRGRPSLPDRAGRRGDGSDVIDYTPRNPAGPLASVIEVRRGPDDAHTGGIEHREALVYTLGKAAELEHLVMLQYLFAAFSLKQREEEGLTPETLAAVTRWRKTLLEISAQEMLHLALVQNLLTAVGAAPRLARPNFPMPAYAYPAGVRIELVPFGEAALRHFAFLERPDGMDVEDAEGCEAIAQAVALPHDEGDEIVPHLQEFDTIGELYRSIAAGLQHLDGRLGTERLFVGQPNAQATEEHFRWPELVAVTHLASANHDIDTIG